MSIAAAVKKTIEDENLCAFGLDVAYGMTAEMKRVSFTAPTAHTNKRNDEGRCIKSTATYKDGSVLDYAYNSTYETFKLTVS